MLNIPINIAAFATLRKAFTKETPIATGPVAANAIREAPFTIISEAGGGGFYGQNTTKFGLSSYGEPRTQSFDRNIIGSGNTVALRIDDDSSNSAFLLDTAILEFAENNRK